MHENSVWDLTKSAELGVTSLGGYYDLWWLISGTSLPRVSSVAGKRWLKWPLLLKSWPTKELGRWNWFEGAVSVKRAFSLRSPFGRQVFIRSPCPPVAGKTCSRSWFCLSYLIPRYLILSCSATSGNIKMVGKVSILFFFFPSWQHMLSLFWCLISTY